MVILRNQFSFVLLVALLQIGFVHTHCLAGYLLEWRNIFTFAKTTSTIEHLDHGNYKGTQLTSDWTSNKEVSSYVVNPEFGWIFDSMNTYVLGSASYGVIYDGRSINYPRRWDIEGNTAGGSLEVGYNWKVSKNFNLLPCIGFDYNVYNTRIHHQKFFHSTINSFVSQNGNKSCSSFYFPYIGFEIDFKSKLYNKYDIQFAVSYEFGYGGGHGRDKVHHTVITDLGSTSRYGSHVNYRDLVMHDLQFTLAYSPIKKWTVALEFDYNIYYNTRKNHLKLDHNRAFVKAGQFTRSQYHVVSDFVSHSYSFILAFIYNSAGEGTLITR